MKLTKRIKGKSKPSWWHGGKFWPVGYFLNRGIGTVPVDHAKIARKAGSEYYSAKHFLLWCERVK